MSSETPTELVVVLSAKDVDGARSRVEAIANITQTFSSRVFVVRCSATDRPALASLDGVMTVTDTDVDPAVLAALDAGEKLQLDGWRMNKQPKVRPNDGLSWDSPGLSPPDKPKS